MFSIDLYEEFSENLVRSDPILDELGEEFSKIIKSKYLIVVITESKESLKEVTQSIQSVVNPEERHKLIKKYRTIFSFYFIIISRLTDYFTQFINSNINILISCELRNYLEHEMISMLNDYFNFVLELASTELNNILVNSNQSFFNQSNTDSKLVVFNMIIKDMLDKDIFPDSVIFEKFIYKFSVFLYFNFLIALLISTSTYIPSERVDLFTDIFNSIFNLNKSILIKEIIEYAKTLLFMTENKLEDFNDLINFQLNSKAIFGIEADSDITSIFKESLLSKIKSDMLCIRKINFIRQNDDFHVYLQEKELTIEKFIRRVTLNFLRHISITFEDFDFKVTQLEVIEWARNYGGQ